LTGRAVEHPVDLFVGEVLRERVVLSLGIADTAGPSASLGMTKSRVAATLEVFYWDVKRKAGPSGSCQPADLLCGV
jgi:hypothetical protein